MLGFQSKLTGTKPRAGWTQRSGACLLSRDACPPSRGEQIQRGSHGVVGSSFGPPLEVKPRLFLEEEPKRSILLPGSALWAPPGTPASPMSWWQRLPLGAPLESAAHSAVGTRKTPLKWKAAVQ